MVDKEEILRVFRKYFDPFDQYLLSKQMQIRDDGTVDVQWNVYMLDELAEIPVKFGTVTGDFVAEEKGLKTLHNMPKLVTGDCELAGNKLTTLIGAPLEVGGNFFVNRNPLVSLDGFPQKVGKRVSLKWGPSLPLLRTLNAREVVLYGQPRVMAIMNKYAGQGKRAMFDCQKDLEDAGFEGNAKW
jgi:hypothetical protein